MSASASVTQCYVVEVALALPLASRQDLARMRGKDGKDRPQDKKRLGCCILCAIMWVMGGWGGGGLGDGIVGVGAPRESGSSECQDQGTCVRSSVVVGTVTSVRCDTVRAAPLGYIARCQASCTPACLSRLVK